MNIVGKTFFIKFPVSGVLESRFNSNAVFLIGHIKNVLLDGYGAVNKIFNIRLQSPFEIESVGLGRFFSFIVNTNPDSFG